MTNNTKKTADNIFHEKPSKDKLVTRTPSDIKPTKRPQWKIDEDEKVTSNTASDESEEIMGLFQFLQYMKNMNLGFPETPKHLRAMQDRHQVYKFSKKE